MIKADAYWTQRMGTDTPADDYVRTDTTEALLHDKNICGGRSRV